MEDKRRDGTVRISCRETQGNIKQLIISTDSTRRDVGIDTFIVQPMDELNLLGVLIDRNLLFSNHPHQFKRFKNYFYHILRLKPK